MGSAQEKPTGELCECGRWLPLPNERTKKCECGRWRVLSRAPVPSPEPAGHSLLRSLFDDCDVTDYDAEETRIRDLETMRWFETLPLIAVGGWRKFESNYSRPIHAETIAFERLIRKGRIEFHPSFVGVVRIRPKQ